MKITKDQLEELTRAATPLIDWLEKHAHPHCEATATQRGVELKEGVASAPTSEKPRVEEPTIKTHGQILYEGYCADTGWKSAVTGCALPQWDMVPPDVKRAWESSARHYNQFITEPEMRYMTEKVNAAVNREQQVRNALNEVNADFKAVRDELRSTRLELNAARQLFHYVRHKDICAKIISDCDGAPLPYYQIKLLERCTCGLHEVCQAAGISMQEYAKM